ncbi:hypothetical protein ACIPIC_40455 [Streptomyces collinus]|uniref:hypothetical protein n=1 Tax=Streptomyces collinus TaxID=42684 RepID=UPI00382578DC
MVEKDWQAHPEMESRWGRSLRPLPAPSTRPRPLESSSLLSTIRRLLQVLVLPPDMRTPHRAESGKAETSEVVSTVAEPKDEFLTLAYDAAKGHLANQTNALEGFRTRASGIFAVAALVTTFSAGLGLVNTDPAKGVVLPWWAPWGLLVLLIVMGVCVFRVLLPTAGWVHGPSAKAILQTRENLESDRELKLAVIEAMVEAQSWNRKELTKRAWAYRVAVLLLLFEILLLIAAVAYARASA